MGIGGIGVWQLLIILAIVFMLFGTKRLRNMGGDLGGAIKGFKKAMKDEKTHNLEDQNDVTKSPQDAEKIIDGEPEKAEQKK